MAAMRLQLNPHVADDLAQMIAEARPLQMHGLQQVSNEARLVNMWESNQEISNNLAVLTNTITWAISGINPNTRHHTDALNLGAGLTYAAALLHFESNVPALPRSLADRYRPEAPADDADDTTPALLSLQKLYQLSDIELERDCVLDDIVESYQNYIPRPEFIPFFRIGAGYTKHLVKAADAHHRLHG